MRWILFTFILFAFHGSFAEGLGCSHLLREKVEENPLRVVTPLHLLIYGTSPIGLAQAARQSGLAPEVVKALRTRLLELYHGHSKSSDITEKYLNNAIEAFRAAVARYMRERASKAAIHALIEERMVSFEPKTIKATAKARALKEQSLAINDFWMRRHLLSLGIDYLAEKNGSYMENRDAFQHFIDDHKTAPRGD